MLAKAAMDYLESAEIPDRSEYEVCVWMKPVAHNDREIMCQVRGDRIRVVQDDHALVAAFILQDEGIGRTVIVEEDEIHRIEIVWPDHEAA